MALTTSRRGVGSQLPTSRTRRALYSCSYPPSPWAPSGVHTLRPVPTDVTFPDDELPMIAASGGGIRQLTARRSVKEPSLATQLALHGLRVVCQGYLHLGSGHRGSCKGPPPMAVLRHHHLRSTSHLGADYVTGKCIRSGQEQSSMRALLSWPTIAAFFVWNRQLQARCYLQHVPPRTCGGTEPFFAALVWRPSTAVMSTPAIQAPSCM